MKEKNRESLVRERVSDGKRDENYEINIQYIVTFITDTTICVFLDRKHSNILSFPISGRGSEFFRIFGNCLFLHIFLSRTVYSNRAIEYRYSQQSLLQKFLHIFIPYFDVANF